MMYYLIAGERSGDLHGGNLITAIRRHDPTARFRAWGGDQMQAAGAELVRHYRDMAFMGAWEVIRNLSTIRRNFRDCKADLLKTRPDVLILIDYAGFNLQMARFAKRVGIPVFYYISPKVWAWNQRRALTIKTVVDRLFVIFPFEVDFFQKFNYKVDYVGNPLIDAISAFTPNADFRQQQQLTDKPIIALLPGSRLQEIQRVLPAMVSVTTRFPDYQFVVAGVSNLPRSLYDNYLNGYPAVSLVIDNAYNLLSIAEAALVTSGTATLETALLNVPQVVCYRTGILTYLIAKWLVSIPYISLVNLIAEKEAVRELVQTNLTTDQLHQELGKIRQGGSHRRQQLIDYEAIHLKIGHPGASERTGMLMVAYLRELLEESKRIISQ